MYVYNEQSVQILKKAIHIFKALSGGKNRPLIIRTILENKNSITVTDISSILGIELADVSINLRALREAKIVYKIAQGKFHYYSVDKDRIDFIVSSAKALIDKKLPNLGNR